MTATIKEVYEYLQIHKMPPSLHILDNECAKDMKEFIQKQTTQIQFFDLNQHCFKAAERTIQTFKSHFIAGLCTVDKYFPLQLWSDLLHHAELSINLLHTSRGNAKISAHVVFGGTTLF